MSANGDEQLKKDLFSAFTVFDIQGGGEGDGKITEEKLKSTIYETLDKEFTAEEISDMMSAIDFDDSRSMEFPEFLNLMDPKSHVYDFVQVQENRIASDMARFVYRHFDKKDKKEGYVSKDELYQILSEHDPAISMTTVQNIAMFIDNEYKGERISKKRFEEMVLKNPGDGN